MNVQLYSACFYVKGFLLRRDDLQMFVLYVATALSTRE